MTFIPKTHKKVNYPLKTWSVSYKYWSKWNNGTEKHGSIWIKYTVWLSETPKQICYPNTVRSGYEKTSLGDSWFIVTGTLFVNFLKEVVIYQWLFFFTASFIISFLHRHFSKLSPRSFMYVETTSVVKILKKKNKMSCKQFNLWNYMYYKQR